MSKQQRKFKKQKSRENQVRKKILNRRTKMRESARLEKEIEKIKLDAEPAIIPIRKESNE